MRAWWVCVLFATAIVGLVFLGNELRQEYEPYGGYWSVASATSQGQPVSPDGWGGLSVQGGTIEFGCCDYGCANCYRELASWKTSEVGPNPIRSETGYDISAAPGRKLQVIAVNEAGQLVTLVFERTSTPSTLFDHFGL